MLTRQLAYKKLVMKLSFTPHIIPQITAFLKPKVLRSQLNRLLTSRSGAESAGCWRLAASIHFRKVLFVVCGIASALLGTLLDIFIETEVKDRFFFLLLLLVRFDLIVADQITFHLPLLRAFCCKKLLFYCHFPDKLLAPQQYNSFLRKGLYRRCLDWAEEWCLKRGADQIVVNSAFTQQVFRSAFPSIKIKPEIMYPGVRIAEKETATGTVDERIAQFIDRNKTFLSLNRFERKKDIHLAIEALSQLPSGVKLIIAGGYDERVVENREHLVELEELCHKHGISCNRNLPDSNTRVLFLPSVKEATKVYLLKNCTALLYTPSNEHFGIVPIESMSHGLPVIAMKSGGPKETVVDGQTGYLCPKPSATELSQLMKKILEMPAEERHKMSTQARKRVQDNFSLSVFSKNLTKITKSLLISTKKSL